MSQQNKTILEKANEAVMNGDNEGFLAFCTEDTRWNFVGDQILEGKEAIRKYMRKAYVEPPKLKVKHLIAEGDFVTAVGEISMKDESGKMVNYEYCDVWRLRDGKLHEVNAYVIEMS